MEVVHANSWKEFESEIEEVQQFRDEKRQEKHPLYVSEVLFRGQADESWGLSTTLERFTDSPISLKKYHNYLERIKSAIETYTGREWNLGTSDDLDLEYFANWPGYPMMIYTRHHGFPSPLLDWTLSPYIALFFALSPCSDSDNAAIYAFIETPEAVKGGWAYASQIRVQGRYATSHERHFAQQAQYTICLEKKENEWIYSKHESYFEHADDKQDYLRKITFPRHIRDEALKRLDLMNINDYSLFRTEEGLMSMLAFREIVDSETGSE